jgi:hypothetical protein
MWWSVRLTYEARCMLCCAALQGCPAAWPPRHWQDLPVQGPGSQAVHQAVTQVWTTLQDTCAHATTSQANGRAAPKSIPLAF